MKRKFKQWWSSIDHYQQREQSPLILTELTEYTKQWHVTLILTELTEYTKQWHVTLEIQDLAWNRHKNAYIYEQAIKKTAQIGFHSKRSHTITNMNDNINMDSAIAGSMNARS
jgi:hypothetical protein